MSKKQYYGIKYPFTDNDVENYFVDVNKETKDKVKSLLMHVVFTPKGQKLRDPEFGTDLIKYIFEQNDETSLDGIKMEVMDAVKKYINGVTVNGISMLEDDTDKHHVYVRLDYTVSNGIKKETDSLVTKVV
jgi:phage baseplate assembly protein W